MTKEWRTYQSGIISKDIEYFHTTGDYNPDVVGVPLIGGSFYNQLLQQSQGLYKNGTADDYRFAETTRGTWWNDNFDFDTMLAFQVERFDAQFGEHYTTEITQLPSYDESRLIYGR